MLKNIALIACISCCVHLHANTDQETYEFNYQRLSSGESIPHAPWYLPPSHFVSGNTYTSPATNALGNPMDVSLTWESVHSYNADGSALLDFKTGIVSPSRLTFDFGETVSNITLTLYGLEGSSGDNPARFAFESIGLGSIQNLFLNDDIFIQDGYYTRQTANNRNGTPMVSVTIKAPVNTLTLYFESREYQISSIIFNRGNGEPHIPEPSSVALLLGTAAVGILLIQHRRKQI